MTLHSPSDRIIPAQPRAQGAVMVSSKRYGARSVIDGFRCSGAFKALFPRSPTRLDAILINSAGGLTGGDRLALTATAGAGTTLALTTQAAERVYRANAGIAKVRTELDVAAGATLLWLPQELILYDGAALDRRLHVDMAADARLLLVEPVVFGRAAMGEHVTSGRFIDRISVDRCGVPLYRDGVDLSDDMHATLDRAAVAGGAGAMASVVYVAPDADTHLTDIRAALPATAGVTLLAADMLCIRILAADSYLLRCILLPVLDRLTGQTLPPSWRL